MPETRVSPREIPWWQNAQNVGQIEAIKQSQAVERERLEFQKNRFNEILGMFRGAFDGVGTDGGFGVPSEFGEAVSLFQPGGQFMEGAKTEIRRGGQQAIAAGQLGFAKTGMSSGTNVAGLTARVSADTALALKKAEDERIASLGGALTTKGTAGLTAQQLRAQREANLMRTLSSF